MKTIKIKDYSQIPKDFTGIIEESNGSKHSFLNGKYHRETGPAIEFANGTKEWYYCGGWQFSFEKVQKVHKERIMNPNIIL